MAYENEGDREERDQKILVIAAVLLPHYLGKHASPADAYGAALDAAADFIRHAEAKAATAAYLEVFGA